jgi:hypothetical protein
MIANGQDRFQGGQPMPKPAQSFKSHARYVPGFHFGVLAVFVLNLLGATWRLWRSPGIETSLGVLMALALLGLLFYARTFALTVQNRVIRLEMRLRLREVLPQDLWPRIGELRVGQLIALRFASDEELPELLRQVLAEQLKDQKAIKRRIRNWQADHLRV